MNYNVIVTGRFEKELKRLAKKYPSLKLGFSKLVNDLSVEPSNGVIIGEGCYKIRIAIGEKV